MIRRSTSVEWSKPLSEETWGFCSCNQTSQQTPRNRNGENLSSGKAKDVSRGEKREKQWPGGEGGAVQSLEVGRGRWDGAVLLGVRAREDSLQNLHGAHHLEDADNVQGPFGTIGHKILTIYWWKWYLSHFASSKKAKASKAGRRGSARRCCHRFVRRQLHQQWLQLPEYEQMRASSHIPQIRHFCSILTCKPLHNLEAAGQGARPIWRPQSPLLLAPSSRRVAPRRKV